MLSVSSANLPHAMRPNIPKASPSPPTLGRKDRCTWNCKYSFAKSRCKNIAARKKIIASDEEDASIGIDVHCQAVTLEEQEPAEESPLDRSEGSQFAESPEKFDTSLPNSEDGFQSIPLLTSSQMQRVKVSRALEEDSIESFSENAEKCMLDTSGSEKECNGNEISKELPVIVVEPNYQNGDHLKRPKLEIAEDPESDRLSQSDDTDNSRSPGLGTKMTHAIEFLMRGSNRAREERANEGAPGIPGEQIVREAIENFPPVMEDNGWESDAEVSMMRNYRDENRAPVEDHRNRIEPRRYSDEDSASDHDPPYYMIGFPNPPGENRCWLNATLHALFALPFFEQPEQLDSEQLRRCSQLTRTLMALRLFWTKGADHKQKTFQTVKLFKESLGILDESYPSQRQQDVSEFLTMFLNYLKSDFEKGSSRDTSEEKSEEAENIPENVQESRSVQRSPQTPTKRSPLSDISPSKRKLDDKSDNGGLFSPKSRKVGLTYSAQDLLSPRVNRVLSKPTDPSYRVHTPPHRAKSTPEFCKNPIDRFFILHMMEHYRCIGCSKHRQRKVDNLMLYVDLPSGSENRTIYLDEAIKMSLEPEERVLTCGKCKHDKHKVFTSFRICPKILMVQVNRYGMCDDGSVAKFNTPVEIPEILQLELGPPDAENGYSTRENFEPVCVIAHVGSAMDCGHYTSYVRQGEDWYHYNDLIVTPMSRYEALIAAQTTAYVVFFVSSKI